MGCLENAHGKQPGYPGHALGGHVIVEARVRATGLGWPEGGRGDWPTGTHGKHQGYPGHALGGHVIVGARVRVASLWRSLPTPNY